MVNDPMIEKIGTKIFLSEEETKEHKDMKDKVLEECKDLFYKVDSLKDAFVFAEVYAEKLMAEKETWWGSIERKYELEDYHCRYYSDYGFMLVLDEDKKKVEDKKMVNDIDNKKLEIECMDFRVVIKGLSEQVRTLSSDPGIMNLSDELMGEARANVMLAYRHLEDARMRIGKIMQCLQGGTSIYDKPEKEARESFKAPSQEAEPTTVTPGGTV